FIIRSRFIFNRTTNEADRRGHTSPKENPDRAFCSESKLALFRKKPQHPKPWTWLGLALRKKEKTGTSSRRLPSNQSLTYWSWSSHSSTPAWSWSSHLPSARTR